MKRRDALRTIGALGATALAPLAADSIAATKRGKSIVDKIVLGDSFFLSKTNPTATTDQLELEQLALKLMQMPLVRQARIQAGQRFKVMAGRDIPPEGLMDFDGKMEEWAWHYTLMAVNSDPNYPKVLSHDYGPPHEWFGLKVPGGRGPGTAENVDNQYSLVPIDPNARYELHGQRLSPAIGDNPLHLVTCLSMAMNAASFDSRDIQYKPDGGFVMTIDRDPANGRTNHIQSTIDTRYLFIRDARIDWRQTPNAYRVRRIDPPDKPRLTVQQMAETAARFIVDDVPMNFFFSQMIRVLDVNTAAQPAASNLFGGQPLQKLGRGHLKLADDEAFVLTVSPGGSEYWVLILYDFWLMSGNYWSRTSTMNNMQSITNADGSHSYVFSIRDPGVHNWIDTLGLHEPMFLLRLQRLPRNPDGSYGGTPSTKGELVKLKDLERVLPAETKWVTPEERKQQIADRLAAFNGRFVI